jgi:hypothetical protein
MWVTTSTSPLRMNSRIAASSFCPAVLVPDAFSRRMIVQPAFVSASTYETLSVGESLMVRGPETFSVGRASRYNTVGARVFSAHKLDRSQRGL